MAADEIDRDGLVAAFRAFLDADAVLSDGEQLKPYECDGLTAYRQTPLVVVLPETIEQVQQVLRVCAERHVPVVARGAGTGLSGGALPLADGVLLVLAKFNRILSIDTENRTARVQPGVRNLAISEAADAYGLYYAPDPSSQIACSIGGNVAENSGGLHCLKYGLTVHNILSLEVLTMDGERHTIGAESLDTAGYDLLALMTADIYTRIASASAGSPPLASKLETTAPNLLKMRSRSSTCSRRLSRSASFSAGSAARSSRLLSMRACAAV